MTAKIKQVKVFRIEDQYGLLTVAAETIEDAIALSKLYRLQNGRDDSSVFATQLLESQVLVGAYIEGSLMWTVDGLELRKEWRIDDR